MKLERSRSQEKIFNEMHRELRSLYPEVPESRERLDPILRMLLQLYSHQLSKIERRVDTVWDVATRSLITSLFPDCRRWPVPAFTVVRCELTDPTVEVDPNTSMIYRERREGGQTFFFSPHRSQKLLAADVRHILLRNGDTLLDIRKRPDGEATQPRRHSVPISPDRADTIFVGVNFDGSPTEFEDSLLFLHGNSQALKQLRWSYWCPGTASEQFLEEQKFCPGLTCDVGDIFSASKDDSLEWGGLRSTADLFRPLEDSFVVIPRGFVSDWQKGPIDRTLGDLAFQSGIELPGDDAPLLWIRVDLPEGGDRNKLGDPIEMMWNCFVATNRSELSLFKHTGGNILVEIELPEHISKVLEIRSVLDSDGREYRPAHEVRTDVSQRVYSVEERDEKLVLWLDFPSVVETPPDSVTVTYSVTSGVDANGIEAGKINEFYESHPGILSCTNVTPTTGAIPAKTKEQVVMEATSRLRNRDRALSFQELSKWVMTFDQRIKKAECVNSTEKTDRGVARCIAVSVQVNGDDFHSRDETELLRTRLKSFLKSRSSVNTRFSVEIVAL